jgi:hypothetical protein
MSAPTHTSGLVYADLERFGEDNVRRELIGGELIVSPSPSSDGRAATEADVVT